MYKSEDMRKQLTEMMETSEKARKEGMLNARACKILLNKISFYKAHGLTKEQAFNNILSIHTFKEMNQEWLKQILDQHM